jgi:hypothetical protein
MANPNIFASSNAYGNTSLTSLSSTGATSIVSNAASSGQVYKINTLVVSNNDASTAYTVTINMYSAAAIGGTAFPWVTTLSVPAASSIVVIDKTSTMYLLENKSIGATAGTANKITVIASWEEIS